MIHGTLTIQLIGQAISQKGVPGEQALKIIDSLKQGISTTITMAPGAFPKSLTIMAHNVQSIAFDPDEGNTP
jgi:hypothetical protein